MPVRRKSKPSRHGTLDENDTDGAVAVSVNQVLQHCQTGNTGHLFGAAGALPPRAARVVEPRFTVYHVLQDERNNTPWIGLNKVTNAERGNIGPIALVPGEYKLELKLPKGINKNLAYDMTGTVLGGLQTLGVSDEERARVVAGRGLPNSYVDVRCTVQAKKYAIADVRGVLDLGVHATFTRVFTVSQEAGGADLRLQMHSHSVIKRLKVEGTLYRRDFATPEPDVTRQRTNSAARRGREILKKALSNESGGSGSGLRLPRTRLDPDVDLTEVVRNFYESEAPDRLQNLQVVFKHFSGRDDDLINTLEAKYSVRFDSRGNFARLGS